MNYTNLGRTGVKVSRLCLGMMTYGDPAWRPWVLTEDQGRPIIRRAIESGINYKLGMSGKNVGARQLSMNVAVIPPGGIAGAHIHDGFEVMLYILEGCVRHDYGDHLSRRVEHQAGDFIFIEPGVPHEVYNLSQTQPVVAVVARSSPDEWDRIIPYEKPL